MAEEKGRVVLFGNRCSGRATVAKMLVSGELNDCPLESTDSNSDCQAYVGRGWTVIDSMGFGEPLGGSIPDEYVKKMVIDFLNEVQGRYSHIIFVVDRADFPFGSQGAGFPIRFMWRTFLETFKGGEENFVVLVTNEMRAQPARMMEESEMDATIQRVFPECKHFLHIDFEIRDGHAVSRVETLERFEKEMEEMFTPEYCPWAELEISKMGNAEIQETAAKICGHLTSSPADTPREWDWRGSAYEQVLFARLNPHSAIRALQGKVTKVLRVRDEMQKLGKEVKLFPRQCEYLLQRSMGASKELQDLDSGTVEGIWNDDGDADDYHLAPLLKSLDRLYTCTEAARELMQLCSLSEEEHEVAFTLSSCPLPGTKQVSKFAQVIRDLEWSLHAFLFLLHNPETQRASSESERQSWLSKFLWCESRGRLVYVGDDEDKGVADGEGEVENVVQSSTVAADNERQAQDQRDLVSAMESHFTTVRQSKKAGSSSSFFPELLGTRIKTHQLSSSEIVSYMTILRNRLQGDASFDGDSSIRTLPGCFRIPGKLEYKEVEPIGKGSYKAVHKCDWLGMEVAIATEIVQSGQLDQGGEDFRRILEVEAGLLARVQHPNVVTFIGCGYDEENWRGFQVSEIMESGLKSLFNVGYRSYMPRYPFSVSQSIDILLQIVEAMIHVHSCGVIYLDLKADNCLANRKFDGFGLPVTVVKLTDFGTSELQSPEMGCLFNTPNKGSSFWRAPEVLGRPGEEVKPLYTWSADVYSFGMTCYEVVTGEVPFQKVHESKRSWLRKEVRNGLRPTIPSNCPEALRELMTKCWAHSPEDRPTFKEIREILWRSRLYHTIWKTYLDPEGMYGQQAIERRTWSARGLIRRFR